MAYDEELADRVRAALGGAAVEEKPMFGGLAFLLGRRMAVAASSTGGLMVRLEPAATEQLQAEPGVGPVTMGARGAMRGWLLVEASAVSDDASLLRWVQRGLATAEGLARNG